MAEAEADSVFGGLPTEVKRKLFRKLSLEDRRNARAVCTVWCDLVDESLSFVVHLEDSTLELVQNMDRPIRSLYVSKLTSRSRISFENSERGDIGTSVGHLFLGLTTSHLPHVNYIISQDNVVSLLSALRKELRGLTIVVRALVAPDPSVFRMIRLENVTKFQVLVRRWSELPLFEGILRMELPSLKNLSLDWDKVYVSTVEKMWPLYESMYAFVASHWRSLRSLELVMPYHWINRRAGSSSSFSRSFSSEHLLERLSRVQLTEIKLRGLPVEGSSIFNLGFHLINNQSSLESLTVEDLKVSYYPALRLGLERSRKSLRSLRIQGSSMGANSHGPVSCSSLLRTLGQLRELVLNNPQITELTGMEDLPRTLERLSLKLPIDGRVLYPWIATHLLELRELVLRPTLWDSAALVDIHHFQRLLGLPRLLKLTLSDGLFQSQEILEFSRTRPGLTLQAASYAWPDLVNVHVHIDRDLYLSPF